MAQDVVVTVTPADAPGDRRVATCGPGSTSPCSAPTPTARPRSSPTRSAACSLFCDEWEQASGGGELSGPSRAARSAATTSPARRRPAGRRTGTRLGRGDHPVRLDRPRDPGPRDRHGRLRGVALGRPTGANRPSSARTRGLSCPGVPGEHQQDGLGLAAAASQPVRVSVLSAIATSRPGPQRTSSAMPSAALIRSLPLPPPRSSRPPPPRRMSRPRPPFTESESSPPFTRSGPRPPRTRSSPSWPFARSRPRPPPTQSSPLPALILSLPARPLIRSARRRCRR